MGRVYHNRFPNSKGGFILPTPSSALSRFAALSRASEMRVKALAAYLFILPTAPSARVNARQKAWRGARSNTVQQCRTFALHASNSANRVPVSRIEFAADRACNYVSELALVNQLVASWSQRARDHGQRAVVTPRVKLSFSFLSPFSIHLIDFIPTDSKQSG